MVNPINPPGKPVFNCFLPLLNSLYQRPYRGQCGHIRTKVSLSLGLKCNFWIFFLKILSKYIKQSFATGVR